MKLPNLVLQKNLCSVIRRAATAPTLDYPALYNIPIHSN